MVAPLVVKRLVEHEFRNLSHVEIEPAPRVNVISGSNGQGKTSLLEALYFVSREGWFLKQVYDRLAPLLGCDIPSHYLYASRRALRVPLVEEPIAHGALAIHTPGPVRAILQSVGLTIDPAELAAAGFDLDDVVEARSEQEALLAGIVHRHREALAARLRQERQDYHAYLDHIGLTRQAHVGLVDAGWFGSSQHAFTRILRDAKCDTRLTGLYLGTHKDGEGFFAERSEGLGYIHHYYDEPDMRPFLEMARVLELLLSAPAASLRRMRMTETGPEPEFGATGSRLQHPSVVRMQAAALEFATRFASCCEGHVPRLPTPAARQIVEGLLLTPTPEAARLLGSLPYDAMLLNDDGTQTFLPNPAEGLAGLRKLATYVRHFPRSSWPIGLYHSQPSLVRVALRNLYPSVVRPQGLRARGTAHARRLARRVGRKLLRA